MDARPNLPPASAQPRWSAFLAGLRASARSAFSYTLFGTFLGFGALCHDLGFGVVWALLATVLIFAGPAQVILVTTLGAGAPMLQAAIAVTLSAIRLLPMTASLLPQLRTPSTRLRALFLPAHFVAVSVWVEVQRLAPAQAREDRIGFTNGLGVGMTIASGAGTVAGFYLAGELPPLLGAALLFLTPIMFLVSTARNCRLLSDHLSLLFGLALTPVLVWLDFELALLVAALVAGSAAYAVHRLREAWR